MHRVLLLLALNPISQESLPGFFLAPGAWAQPEHEIWVGQPEELLGETPPQDLSLSSSPSLLKASSIPTTLRSHACCSQACLRLILLSPSHLFPVPSGGCVWIPIPTLICTWSSRCTWWGRGREGGNQREWEKQLCFGVDPGVS